MKKVRIHVVVTGNDGTTGNKSSTFTKSFTLEKLIAYVKNMDMKLMIYPFVRKLKRPYAMMKNILDSHVMKKEI